MGFFSGKPLDPSIEQVVVGTDKSANRNVAKIQDAFFSYLERDEVVRLVAGSVQMGAVVAITDRRILYGDGRQIDYVLPGNRVNDVTLAQAKMSGGPYCPISRNGAILKPEQHSSQG